MNFCLNYGVYRPSAPRMVRNCVWVLYGYKKFQDFPRNTIWPMTQILRKSSLTSDPNLSSKLICHKNECVRVLVRTRKLVCTIWCTICVLGTAAQGSARVCQLERIDEEEEHDADWRNATHSRKTFGTITNKYVTADGRIKSVRYDAVLQNTIKIM